MGVMDYIREYVEQAEMRVPILTSDIYEYVRLRVPNVQKNVLNEYIVRYSKVNPNFIRHKYCVPGLPRGCRPGSAGASCRLRCRWRGTDSSHR